jgi:hypothetical protein
MPPGSQWEVTLDTNAPDQPPGQEDVIAGRARELAARSLVLLRRCPHPSDE